MDKFTEELIRKVSTEQGVDVETVSKIIGFQFRDMLRAARTSRNIEMTWFGKWYASPGKCRRKIAHYEQVEQFVKEKLNREENLTTARISSYNSKLRSIRESIEFLRSKMDYEIRYKGIDRGDMEQYICEGASGDHIETATEHLQELSGEFGQKEDGRIQEFQT